MPGLRLVGLVGGVVVGYEGKAPVLHTTSRVVFECGSWLSADPLSGRVHGEFTGLGKLAIARATPCNPALCNKSYTFVLNPVKLGCAGKLEDSTKHGPDFIEFFDQSRVIASS